ncbi:5167_t:CDS:2, partial [Acaulospora morrowiae]
MWCDNCLLLFPLRSGAMVLSVIMMIYQIGGGIFLFLYGDFFFFHYMEPKIYGAYAMIQAFMSLIATIGFSIISFTIASSLVCFYPFLVILGAVRAGIMSWSLVYYKERIIWECDNGGTKWVDPSTITTTTDTTSDPTLMPPVVCRTGVDNFNALITTGLCIDFILM